MFIYSIASICFALCFPNKLLLYFLDNHWKNLKKAKTIFFCISNKNHQFFSLVPATLRPRPSLHGGRVHPLVPAETQHRRLLRRRKPDRQNPDGPDQLLHAALHYHEPPDLQQPEGRILVLQRR